MKRLLLVLAIGIASSQSYAQTTFGIKAGANISNYIMKDMGDMKSTMGVGAYVGGFTKIAFSDLFSLQPELLFQLQNSKLEQSGVKSDIQTWAMEIPIHAMFTFKSGDTDKAYLGIGPYGRLGFSAKDRTANVNRYKGDNSIMDRGDVGVSALIGYEFGFGMQINASYKYGLINQLKDPVGDAFIRNQMISLGIGYRF